MTIFETEIFGITLAPTYYGLMYALAFIIGYLIIKKRKVIYSSVKKNDLLDDLFFYVFLGVVLGGRLGYVVFYGFSDLISDPISLLRIWEGGMSFHGGVIGVVVSMLLFSRKNKISFLKVADQVTLVLPIGLGLGRIGNYLNQELLGYSGYNGILAIYKNGIGYFPSPLLEAFLEGVILLVILNIVYYLNTKVRCMESGKQIKYGFDGQIASLFLIFYSLFRIFVEVFFRTPDSHIGYLFGFLTVGEILSLPMLIVGVFAYFKLKK